MRRRPLSNLAIAVSVAVLLLAQSTPALAATWPPGTHRVSLSVQRAAGADRYATSVESARVGWPGWTGVDRVIIATGDSSALADPLAAGSLSWAYDAPLLLVQRNQVPQVVREALAEIVAENPSVDITIVGGPSSVSPGVSDRLSAIVKPGVVDRVDGADRYATAAAVALRSAEVAQDTSRTVPARALVANGTTAFNFVDALSLSAVSACTGVPILLVERDVVPSATQSALGGLPAGDVIVAGGSSAVSARVYGRLGGTKRWGGVDRYKTSVEIAGAARSLGWLTGTTVGLAATVPDALTGSISMARIDGPLLVTRQAALDQSTASYLAGLSGSVSAATIFGGTAVVSRDQQQELLGHPTVPGLQGPAAGSLQAKRVRIRAQVGINTTEVQLWAGTKRLTTKPATSYSTVDFGDVLLPADGVPLRVVARNVDGRTSEVNRTYRRLSYPAATSIVIDKSDFRLYFVKNDTLVKAYPIAIGRPGMETPTRLWKINTKYYSSPTGVYGPRKMRLYAKSGSSWRYTSYLIHGTNEPWVIGTKASHGCVRMYNKDVLELYPQVPLGTLVLTRE